MRIYISVDMEGIGGVVRPAQVQAGTHEYALARQWAVQEILAITAGAREAGATAFYVKDAHGTGTNLPWELFANDIRLVTGRTRPIRFPGFDSSFDALFLVGYHAMAGTTDAVLNHTWAPGVHFFMNGKEVGEIAVDAAIAGAYGVPVALVSGDDRTSKEAQATLGTVETIVVKEAVTEQGAVLYPIAEVHRRAEAGGLAAVERLRSGAFRPYKPRLPLHFRMTWTADDGTEASREAAGDDVRAVFRQVLDQG